MKLILKRFYAHFLLVLLVLKIKIGNIYSLLGGVQTCTVIAEIRVAVPQELRIDLPRDPVLSPLGIHPKDSISYC